MKINLINYKPPRIAIAYLVIAFVLHTLIPADTITVTLFLPIGIFLFAAGFILTIWSWVLFKKEKTELCPLSEENKKLITTGPYRFTRNPMYLGAVFMLLGAAFYVGSIAMFLASLAFYITINNVFIPYEETKMEKQHGKQYADYKSKARKWI